MSELPTPYQQKCACCENFKSANEFYKNSRYTSGLSSYCKECMKAYKSGWDDENVERRALIQRRAHYRSKYGLSLEELDAMILVQGNRCAICEYQPEPDDRPLDVDHSHETGVIRGLLCMQCNQALGKFKDDPIRLQKAILYLMGNLCLSS